MRYMLRTGNCTTTDQDVTVSATRNLHQEYQALRPRTTTEKVVKDGNKYVIITCIYPELTADSLFESKPGIYMHSIRYRILNRCA